MVYFKACCSDEARIINKIESQLLHWFTCNPSCFFFLLIFTCDMTLRHYLICQHHPLSTDFTIHVYRRDNCKWMTQMYWAEKKKNHTIIPYTTMTQVQLIDLFIGHICGKWRIKGIPNIYNCFGGNNLHRELWMKSQPESALD